MWTVFRFSLAGGGERAYRDALEILRGAGLQPAPGLGTLGAAASFPAAVVADVGRCPSDVTRAICEALHEAGLRPVGVSGCALGERPAAERGARA